MNEYVVLKEVFLNKSHQPTGKTQHLSRGEKVSAPVKLKIVRYPEEIGYYLIHFDEKDDELTDTYHKTVIEAVEQAKWEFQIQPDEWVELAK